MARLVKSISVPLAFNLIPGGKTPNFALAELEDLGVKYISIPMVCIYPAVRSMQEALKALRAGDLNGVGELGINWSQFNELIGVRRWRRLEEESAAR